MSIPPRSFKLPSLISLILRLMLMIWASSVAAVAQEGKIKVLIVEGISNHAWQKRLDIVRAILTKEGSFELDFSITPATAGDPAWATWRPDFAAYDVVISGYNNRGGLPAWPEQVKTSLAAYVHGGGGFYAFHEATESFAEWPEYNRMIGLGRRDKNFGPAITLNADGTTNLIPAGAGEDTNQSPIRPNAILVTKRGSHPIHDGLPATWMAANLEIYRYARGPAENLTVLSYATDDRGIRFPIDWVVEYGQGRCYTSSYGHVDSFASSSGTRCAAFQTVMIRALKWLAGRNPDAVAPADFPPATAVSLRPHEEGVGGLDQAPSMGAFANGVLPQKATPITSASILPAFTQLSWNSPIQAVPWPGSTDLVIAETDGRLYRLLDDDLTTTRSLILDIRDRTWYYNWSTGDNNSKHGGMQTIAFHPRFGKGEGKDHLYVFYLHHSNSTNPNAAPPYYDRVSRFTWDAASSTFPPGSELVMINQYDTFKGHDGGGLAFGADGFLYISYGDEGNGAVWDHTQKINDRARSGVWRIDVDQRGGAISHPIIRQPYSPAGHGSYTQGYYIPNDNPWVDPGGSMLEEYYAIGLRQPHRMTFDPATGFWIGEVGEGRREEVDLMDAPGLNFQWPYREGSQSAYNPTPSPLIGADRAPLFDYDHSGPSSLGYCIIGGYVYRGATLPWLQGKYIFGDNGTQGIYALDFDPVTRKAGPVTLLGMAGPSSGIFGGISSFGHTAAGELLVMRMGGGIPGAGRLYRIKLDDTIKSNYPTTLSATGLFSNTRNLIPAAGLIPYDINMPLWSDGVEKQRWMMVPTGGKIGYSGTSRWSLPSGAVLVKNFAMPNGGRNLETRVLVNGTGGWGGVTYKWLPDGSDAVLLEEGGIESLEIEGERFDYHYPSPLQCNTCHIQNVGGLLGLSTHQMNRHYTYPATGRTANQIETFSKVGLITDKLSEVTLRNKMTAADRDDPTVKPRDFVRSYLDSNCSHCHTPGITRANFDARLFTPLELQNLICGPVNDHLGIAGAAMVKPGLPGQSILMERINTVDAHRMPPLGRGRVDQKAVAALGNWILGMETTSCGPPVVGWPAFESVEVGLGNKPVGSVSSEYWGSSMIIHKADTYTNRTGGPLEVTLDRFRFHAARVSGAPLTPFVVRVNPGIDNFTVLAIGTTITTHGLGANDHPFSSSPSTLILAPGETIAMAFLDAYPNGTKQYGQGDISYSSGTAGSVHRSGGSSYWDSGKVTVGQPPVFGYQVQTNTTQTYNFSISVATPWTIGNNRTPAGIAASDPWQSNMVINKTDTFTNYSETAQEILVDRFIFHTTGATGTPVTPFVSRVNGENDFTVLAIGNTVTAPAAGYNSVPFSDSPVSLVLAAGETIAMGFLDAFSDGSGPPGTGIIAYEAGGASRDQIHLSGGANPADSGKVTVGQSPVFGSTVITDQPRDYYFSIVVNPIVNELDRDRDGLPDTWEKAWTTNLDLLSATGDSDGDGQSDEDERIAGTNPLDRASVLQTLELQPDPSNHSLKATFASVPGRRYRILTSSDLSSWIDRGIVTAANWPATSTPFEVNTEHPNGGGAAAKLFVKITTVSESP